MKTVPSMGHVRIYRAVVGAVRNTAHGHPRWPLTEDMARSIAKRAAGTLTADWPDVLAARHAPSVGASGASCWPPPDRRAYGTAARGASRRSRRSPFFRLLHNRIGAMVGEAKHAGATERAAILIEVLRLLAGMEHGRGQATH